MIGQKQKIDTITAHRFSEISEALCVWNAIDEAGFVARIV
jgi:hypothetical protein